MTDVGQLFEAASELFRARDAAGAEARLRELLAGRPDHAPALNLLALIAGQAGRDAECVELLTQAIRHGTAGQAAASGLLLAAAHARAGRPAEAETAYRQVLARTPGSGEAALRLGLLLLGQGREGEALGPLQAAAADPSLAVAHGALATARKAAGDLEGAAASAERAVALAPHDRNFAANLAVIRNAQGRFGEAEALCRRALKGGEDPGLLNTLGVALKEQGRLEDAASSFERAAALQPGFVQALYNLAGVRKDQGRADEAIALLREVVALAPDLPAARFALCMALLPPLYDDEAEIAARRSAYADELDALVAHADRVGPAALAPGVGAAQPFQLAYQGQNDVELQRRYGRLVCRAMAGAFAQASVADAPRPGERIRVGVVCGYFRDHSVWRLPTRGWIEGLDRSRFELIGYHTSPLRDAETDRAERLFDRFVQGPFPTATWRDRIAGDRPHALIYPEVGMDPEAVRLAALRLARVQYASWGHPSTTGLPTIDAFLSSDLMEPEDGQDHYGERLVRLPGLSTAVAIGPLTRPIPSRASLGLPEQGAIFWCGQSLAKYLPRYDEVFPAIAARLPGCRFVFIEHGPELTGRWLQRLSRAFAAQGLDAGRFCIVLPRMDPEAFRAAMGCADVVLDSLGWSGCNSLVDALAHALPIVSMPGDSLRSRHGAAILRTLGLERLICPTLQAYVATAVVLGADAGMRAAARRDIENGLDRLNQDAPRAIAALEAELMAAARR